MALAIPLGLMVIPAFTFSNYFFPRPRYRWPLGNKNNNNNKPIAVETLGVFNASAIRLLNDLGRRISSISGDTIERLVICISEFRCWCSASMLFCYTTACRSLTTPYTD